MTRCVWDFDQMNRTELVELCKQVGFFGAHHGLGRETLIDLLSGKIDYGELSTDPIDEDREVMCFMQERYPDIIFGQLKCSSENYACHDCPPGRVVSCVVVNCATNLRQQVKDDLEKEQRRRGR